ncbi:MOSC and FAD-binding oxidoreductase domain-containing protein [Rugosimonospora acidiphila]
MTGVDSRGPATLLSVNVGMPADHEWSGGVVRTAIWKSPVTGPVRVGRLNVAGDGQADKLGHGGESRAVMVYQIESYDYWRRELGRDDLEFGHFGENFTVTGLADDEVCIGDRYRIGTTVFEVTQPRVTCYRVGIRLGVPTMASLLVRHRRPGFYLRVLEEGEVQAGDSIVRIGRPTATLTVAGIDGLLYLPGRSTDDLRVAIGIDALSAGWRGDFVRMLDETAAAEDPHAARGWQGFTPLRVVNVRRETEDIRSVVLAAADVAAGLPAAAAGQYLTIRVPSADGSGANVRNYSLSSAPGADQYRISVKREPLGAVSSWLHTGLTPGSTLDVAQPRGTFLLKAGTNPVLLASAGIGITPVLAMLHALAAEGSARHVFWVHVARTPEAQAFAAEVEGLLASLPSVSAHTFYTKAASAGSDGRATPHSGRPDIEALRALQIPVDADAYVCGPASFMTTMTASLAELGLDPQQVHSETFGASATPGPDAATVAHAPDGPPGTGPAVTFSRSGLTVPFDSRYGNLLELAEACEIPVRWSCRTGVCHSCITTLVSGAVDYEPQPLDPPAGNGLLLCCAKPTEEIVLDA